jgi:hypothetical protein
MMLTINDSGKLAVFSTGSYTQLEVDNVYALYDVMQDYDVDFISPTLVQPQDHTKDETLLAILRQFRLAHLQTIMAHKLLKEVPQA